MGKIVRAGAGAGIFDKLEPELEPEKNGPAPQHWFKGTFSLKLKKCVEKPIRGCLGPKI
jgi:hypothetical protein